MNIVKTRPEWTKERGCLQFIDFRKIFESINRNLLLEKMENMKVNHKIINTIRDLLTNTKLIINDQEILTDTGFMQGSVLSPILFNLFINDLLTNGNNQNVLAFADDIVYIL